MLMQRCYNWSSLILLACSLLWTQLMLSSEAWTALTTIKDSHPRSYYDGFDRHYFFHQGVLATTTTKAIHSNPNHVSLPFRRRNSHLLAARSDMIDMDFNVSNDFNVILVSIIALALAVAAQAWINQMVQGDQGLGAFMKDGSGWKGSAFRPTTTNNKINNTEDNDPLPWLKLPKLDFVEVAGQTSASYDGEKDDDDTVVETLQLLQQAMNAKLQQSKVDEARILRNELEKLMAENGIEYNTNNKQQ